MCIFRSQLNMIADTRKTPSSRGSLFTNFEDVQVSVRPYGLQIIYATVRLFCPYTPNSDKTLLLMYV